jgi:ATP-dependent Clp protease ATP-binding subunit ClpA
MMSEKLQNCFNHAVLFANTHRHEFLCVETVLYSLLKEDQQIVDLLLDCDVSIDQLNQELEVYLKEDENFSILSEEEVEEMGELQFENQEVRKLAKSGGIDYQPELALSLQRILQRAAMHVQSSSKQHIQGINILIGIFSEKESFAYYLLDNAGVERIDIVDRVAHGLDAGLNTREDHEDEETAGADQKEKGPKESPLELYARNLNERAIKGKIDPLIGRKEEVARIFQILCRRRKNNPMLVGDPGVGKTAIVEGLALEIVNKNVPEVVSEATVYSLDLASLLAGTKYRGDFEARVKAVLKDLEKRRENGEMPILFVDEIHTLMGAGSTGGGGMDLSNLLRPALSSSELWCIGSTGHEEYRKHIEKDSAFSRRFQKVDIEAPSREETVRILMGLRPHFEEHHQVKFSNAVLKEIVRLSGDNIYDRNFPDKAIDIMDELGASIKVLGPKAKKVNVTKQDVEKMVAKIAKIPIVNMSGNQKEKLKNLNQNIKMFIFGQDDAVNRVTDAIHLSRSGLSNNERPIANFLFTGPTGVGKTELARVLSTNLGATLVRFDMSEYMEKHSVAKLVGAPPGYVGHEEGGGLTDAVKKHPQSVVLLDEIEKAHPDILNVLLQVLDYGKLTDSHGRTTDFSNTVIILTTNAGAREMDSGSVGLVSSISSNTKESKADKAIKNFFSPEFRNRLDAIIHFNKLREREIVKIVQKNLVELEEKLNHKKVEFSCDQEVISWFVENGYDPKMGARPLARLIDEKIKKVLSQEILFGKLEKGGSVNVKMAKKPSEKSPFEFIFS